MLNNGTVESGDSWDSLLGNNCTEGEEEVFKLFADCQTPPSLFMSKWFSMGIGFTIFFCLLTCCCGCCCAWGVERQALVEVACSYICIVGVIIPLICTLQIILAAITALTVNHPFYYGLVVLFLGLLLGGGEDRGGASRDEDTSFFSSDEEQGSVSRSDRRWRCGGWLIMLRARHNRAKTWRRRTAVIIEDLEGPKPRLLQADLRGSPSRTSLPPSFRRYTDHISGEFRHREASDSREQFEELVAWISCIEVEGIFRLVVEYL